MDYDRCDISGIAGPNQIWVGYRLHPQLSVLVMRLMSERRANGHGNVAVDEFATPCQRAIATCEITREKKDRLIALCGTLAARCHEVRHGAPAAAHRGEVCSKDSRLMQRRSRSNILGAESCSQDERGPKRRICRYG